MKTLIQTEMRCWICGDIPNTKEHLIKKSDLRSIFGERSSKNPLFIHSLNDQSVKINGLSSDILKSGAMICSNCNNSRSQPFDRAWECLSNHLRSLSPSISSGMTIKLDEIFKSNTKQSLTYVHLYFVKLFGCIIKEHNIPIDINEFSYSILENTPHSKIHLAFEAIENKQNHQLASRTDVKVSFDSDKIIFAIWLYDVGPLSVHVIYADTERKKVNLDGTWHPNTLKKLEITLL